MSLWTSIASVLTGGVVKSVADWHVRTLASGDTRAQIDADLTAKAGNLALRERDIHLRMQRLDAEGGWLGRNIRPLFALPFVIYAFKAVAIDKVIGPMLGYDLSTDAINGDLAVWGSTIIAFYMGGKTIETVVKRLTSR